MADNKPVRKINRFPVQAAIWANPGKEGRTNYSVTVVKRYKADDGQYKDTPTLFASDLLVMAEVLREAWRAIGELEAATPRAPEAPKSEHVPF